MKNSNTARSLLVASFGFVACLVTGCGGGEPGAANPPANAAAPAATAAASSVDVAGRWQSDCLGPQNGSWSRLTFDNSATEWKLDYDSFGDAACKAALGTVHIEGPYRIEGSSSVVAGAAEGVFSFAKRTVTPRAQGFADFLHSAGGCGGGTFTVGVATDILEKGCAGLGAYPRATCSEDHDLVRRDGKELHFGERPANNDMCTKEKRPRALSKIALKTM